MRTGKLAIITVLLALSPVVWAADSLDLTDETTGINYSLGYQIGGDFKRQNVQMNAAAVIKGIEDALAAHEPLLSPAAMHSLLTDLKRRVVAEQSKQRRKAEVANIDADKAFTEEFRKQDGVRTTASGLLYRVIADGNGKTATGSDTVTVNYRGTLTNGNEFDSSYKRGGAASFPLNTVIKGWTEGLQLVKEGGKIQLVVPPALAYGERGPLAHRTLVFDVELVAVNDIQANAIAAGPH